MGVFVAKICGAANEAEIVAASFGASRPKKKSSFDTFAEKVSHHVDSVTGLGEILSLLGNFRKKLAKFS